MLKKKVDGLEDYYYQWMNKYKDDAARRIELLKEVLDQVFPHPDTWSEIFCEDLIDRLTKELDDA